MQFGDSDGDLRWPILVRGSEFEILEGDYKLDRFVVIQFPDKERARR